MVSCVLLVSKIWTTRSANFRHPDVQIFYIWSSATACCQQVKLIEICLPLAAPPDGDELLPLQLLNVGVGAVSRYAHVHGEPLLARKTIILLPGILQQHRIHELRAWREPVADQHMVEHLRVPLYGKHVGALQNDIAVEDLSDPGQHSFA